MSKIEVNTVEPQCGTTLTLGGSGDTVALGSGASQTGFGRTGTVDWETTVKTGDFTSVSGKGYFVNTDSGAINVTLPATPSAGDIVSVADYSNNFSTNNCVLLRNSSNIGGRANDATLKVAGIAITLVYIDGTQGWIVIDDGQRSTADNNPYLVACGGTEVTCGNYKTHIFTGPGSFTVSTAAASGPDNVVEYLVVGGGASGGRYIAGGGGAGGVRTFTTLTPATPINAPAGITVSVQSYPITVGAGGAGAGPAGNAASNCANGNPGCGSTFDSITSAGGGGGGYCAQSGLPGASGGGAGGRGTGTGGTGNVPVTAPVQGFAGGSNPNSPTCSGGGGGGGATTVGGIRCAGTPKFGGTGGTGAFLNNSFFGPTAPSYGQAPAPLAPNGRYFGGGGGAGGWDKASPDPFPTGGTGYIGNGGVGGGGSGSTQVPGAPTGGVGHPAGEAGAINTGGGGGVAAISSGWGNQPGAGGSGIVAIRYRFQ